ncbi:acetoacetate--CoA ligase [Pseudomaricurvus alcaniphilus]|uniref:acetoacetate--CoA ligase n=1 Tax=Pseudomaricurvus alcaniphilus TaxID=1166482 RepID=UPI00140A1463|nr:acetoacetate--CoA ligase [Pseudomaricurvus alcaniphilus]NHN36524.1 acetoacetate--CoA ligase [Pseudomaricurvus alcaniphilus]
MTSDIDKKLKSVAEGDLLWTPSDEIIAKAKLTRFTQWLEQKHGITFANYNALWQWSTEDISTFWAMIWDYFEVISDTPYKRVIDELKMPGAKWFEGSKTNYAEHLLRHEAEAKPGKVAFYHSTETRSLATMSWQEVGDQVRKLATRLRELGIKPGDRVVSYMPNVPETAIAMLATTAIGAIWSSAAPEFGANTVVERFGQIEPKFIFAGDGYSFSGKIFDRRTEVAHIIKNIPSIETLVWLPYMGLETESPAGLKSYVFSDLLNGPEVAREEFSYERVGFDHPLWVLFSSGTTGKPKSIVHSHVGMIVEHLKTMTFHCNLGPDSTMFFYSTTGWMMWNSLVSSLITGASAVLYDGSPVHGGVDMLWRMVQDTGVTFFGASPTLVQNMKKAGVRPAELFDLSKFENILLGGAPSSAEVFQWFYDEVKQDLWVSSQSGGTEVCSGLVGGVSTQPVYAGEIQGRGLGIDVRVWDDEGNDLVDEIGELVLAKPAPCMPIYLWGDEGGKRYHDSYFDVFPGIWCHGDQAKINARGGVYIYGRSDATLNRFGVRIGSAEIYRIVDAVDGIKDSLVIGADLPDGGFYMPLFVALEEGVELTNDLINAITTRLRKDASPRHVPDEIHVVPVIPYTLTGKKMEVPIRKIIMGTPHEKAVSRDAMADPSSLSWFLEFSRRADVVAKRS